MADPMTGVFVVLALLAMAYLVWALAIICDDYLMPALEDICELVKLSPEAAGATVLAFGSSSPEIFMNTFGAATGDQELSLSGLLGGAIISVGLIPAVCSYFVPGGGGIVLERPELLRDLLFLCVGFLAVLVLKSQEAAEFGSVYMILMYPVYVAAVLYMNNSRRIGRGSSSSSTTTTSSSSSHSSSSVVSAGGLDEALMEGGGGSADEGEEMDAVRTNPMGSASGAVAAAVVANQPLDSAQDVASATCVDRFSDRCEPLRAPLDALFMRTFPVLGTATRGGTWLSCALSRRSAAWLTFAISIVSVAALSLGVIELAEYASRAMGVSACIAGLTVLGVLLELPDTIACVALAKRGHGAAAVSASLGAQVMVSTIGIGLPCLVQAVRGGAAELKVVVADAGPPIVALTLVTATFLTLVMLVDGTKDAPRLKRRGSNWMMLAYLATIVALVLLALVDGC